MLAVALRIPTTLLTGPLGPVVGVDFLALRRVTKLQTVNGPVGLGVFRTVSRMGNPFVGNLLPYDLKNAYASASARQDAALQFATPITNTFNEFGITNSEASSVVLDNLFLTRGDLLLLQTNTPNPSIDGSAAYPNGRRLQDDVEDTLLTLINHGTALGDGVSASDTGLTANFPFLGSPHQPQPGGVTDDQTRN